MEHFYSTVGITGCKKIFGVNIKLSHLSAHVVNSLLRENRKYIPICFNGKKGFKKCNLPDFKFYLDKLNNDIPYGAMFILYLITALNTIKSKENLTVHHMRKLISSLSVIKFKIWRVTFLKSFLPLKHFGMVFRFSCNRRFTTCALR